MPHYRCRISVRNDDYQDMWIGTAGVKYRYAARRAVSFGALYASSPTTDSRRNIALPFDRIIEGSFSTNWAVALDFQLVKRF